MQIFHSPSLKNKINVFMNAFFSNTDFITWGLIDKKKKKKGVKCKHTS